MEVLFLFIMIIGLLLLGTPIAISLGLSSIIFLLVYSDSSLASIAQTFYNAMFKHYTLLAIPFFILASSFMSTGGVAKRIIRFANAMVGHFRGGLGIASVLACMLFAALSGSSPATVVAVGSITIAAMRKHGYSKEFAAGVIANAGTLGILIPPSIVMVVYASATDVSVGRMFVAGIIPGLIAGLSLMIGIYIAALIKKMPKGQFVGWGEFFASFLDASWGLFLMVIILGGIYGGIFTPTEAAAVASVYAIIVALFIYRDMGPLANKPWILPHERPTALLGARVIGFIIATTLLYLIAGSMVVAKGAFGISSMMFFYFAAAIFSIAAIVLGGLYAITAHLAVQRLLTVGTMIIMGVIPVIYLALKIYTGSDSTTVLRILLCTLMALGWILPLAMMLYAFQTASEDLSNDGRGYGASLIWGARNIARGVLDIFVWLAPAGFSTQSRQTIFEAARLTIMLMFIIANALILKHVLTDEQIPQHIAGMITDAGFGKIIFLLMVNVILLIGGQFMEPSGLIVIVAPLVFPIAMALGVDPIHLGIIMVVNMEIGMITPPVGLNLFVTSGVAKMPMLDVVRASLPWLMILMAFLVLITYVPSISTWLYIETMGPEIVIR